MRIIWLKKQRLRNPCVATRNGSCGCFVAPAPVPFFAPLWATLLSMDMSSTRRAQLTTGVQGGRSGPPAPHPLLTSLTAQPASGDASILTSGDCELLRSDAKVRRRRPPRVAPHSHRLVHLDGHGRASCHVRSASLCLQRARWPGARRCVERCSTPSPETALIGMEASARNGPVAPTTWPRRSPSSADGRSLP